MLRPGKKSTKQQHSRCGTRPNDVKRADAPSNHERTTKARGVDVVGCRSSVAFFSSCLVVARKNNQDNINLETRRPDEYSAPVAKASLPWCRLFFCVGGECCHQLTSVTLDTFVRIGGPCMSYSLRSAPIYSQVFHAANCSTRRGPSIRMYLYPKQPD